MTTRDLGFVLDTWQTPRCFSPSSISFELCRRLIAKLQCRYVSSPPSLDTSRTLQPYFVVRR